MRLLLDSLRDKIASLEGDFILPKNNYEPSFCQTLGWSVATTRYYDAKFHDCLIEMKKGQNGMFFDMVRYSEIYLGKGDQGTWTVFFRYHKARKKVSEIYIIDTKRILSFLRLDRKKAETCIRLKEDQTRGLVMQASMTKLDMEKIADCIVLEDGSLKTTTETMANPQEIRPSPPSYPPPPPWIRSMMSRSQQKQYWWHDRMQESSWSPLKWYDTVNQAWL